MTLRTTATALAAGLLLAACGGGETPEPAQATSTPTETASPTPEPEPEPSLAAEPVDLMVIPDEISDAYVAALVEATQELYVDLAANTNEGGGFDERGYGTLTLNVTADEIDFVLAEFDDAYDGTLTRTGEPFGAVLDDVITAGPECISALVDVTWEPYATMYAQLDEIDGLLYWLSWRADLPADGITAWDLDTLAPNAEGQVTEDPCSD